MAMPELVDEGGHGRGVLGDNHDAGGIPIEAVNDAGTFFAADAGEVGAVGEEGVHEGAGGVAGGGMNDQTGGFVDDDDVSILEQKRGFDGRGDVDGDGGVPGQFLARLDGMIVQADVAGIDQGLDSGSREVWEE
jgi:hypothetical protein